MIQSFKNKATEDIFNGNPTKKASKICPSVLWKQASRKLDQLDSVLTLDELRIPPGNRLEFLSGDRKGQFSIRIRIPTHRAPTHPGEMLLEEFLNPMEITQRQLADAIHVPYQRVNEIINGRRGVTPATALRLAKFFGMSADYWMNIQQRWDLYHARKSEDKLLKTIKPVTPKMVSVL